MTQHEELAVYKAALIDWEKPYDHYDAVLTYTWSGLCHYFKKAHGIDAYGYADLEDKEPYFSIVFPTLYKFRNTDLIGAYLWEGKGENVGRTSRVNALKKAINELETILNLQKGV